MEINEILCCDALDGLRGLPSKSVQLVVTDPPYNIGKASWDKIDGYVDWCRDWMRECSRVLTDNGVFYWFHSDMPQVAQLMEMIRKDTDFKFLAFLVWNKQSYREFVWRNRDPGGRSALRRWFQTSEYCLHYAKAAGTRPGHKTFRYVHHCDPNHNNVWSVPTVPSGSRERIHVCQKPVEIIRRMIRVSSNPGDLVLDPFMGSGTTGLAAWTEGRDYIGFEMDAQM